MRLVVETGKPLAQVARELGVNAGTLGELGCQGPPARDRGNGALSEDERAELTRLRRGERRAADAAFDVLKRSVALWVNEAMGSR